MSEGSSRSSTSVPGFRRLGAGRSHAEALRVTANKSSSHNEAPGVGRQLSGSWSGPLTDRPTRANVPLVRASAMDLLWLGRPEMIATWRVNDVLVDCGPSTCLDRLLAVLDGWRPKALLLTHIHFDHAGAAGALVQRWPDLRVLVHRKGVRHLVDPARLESSARTVFGEDFDRLFGTLVPVPEDNITPLDGGEAAWGFDVIYTPGHAKHHVAYMHHDTRLGFVGDVAAVRLREGNPVLPPTPPPDIDVPTWLASIDAVAAWNPRRLALPHFGYVEDAAEHLAAAMTQVRRHAEISTQFDERGYVETIEEELRQATTPEVASAYMRVVPLAQNFAGLRRAADGAQERTT